MIHITLGRQPCGSLLIYIWQLPKRLIVPIKALQVCLNHVGSLKYVLTDLDDLYHPGAAALWLPPDAHSVEHELLLLGLFQPGSSQVPQGQGQGQGQGLFLSLLNSGT